MRRPWPLLTLFLCAAAGAQTQAPAAPPQTYALIAAMGKQMAVVTEVKNVGSHMEPYDRQRIVAGNDILNRLVLQDLDQNVTAMDPDSVRVFLSMPTPNVEHVNPERREQYSIDSIIAELKKHEQERRGWNRIIVVTPAYRIRDKEGHMGTDLQGMGMFVEPLCQTNPKSCDQTFDSISGGRVALDDDKNTFIAPYSYLNVWQLDPATLNVIASTRVFKDERIPTPQHAPQAVDKHLVAAKMEKLLNASIREGLHRSEATGHVEVVELKDAPASDAAR